MWLHNSDISLKCMTKKLCVCPRIVSTSKTPDTFPGEFILQEMVKSEIPTIQYGVKEVFNWQTF